MLNEVEETTSPPEQAPAISSRLAEEQRMIQEAVRWTRLLVVAVFVLCAAIVGSLAYVVVSDSEQDDYQKQFTQAAHEVLRVASDKAVQASQMVAGMADIYTSFSHHRDDTDQQDPLPYLTLHDFEVFGTGVRQVSRASLVFYTPYLSNSRFLEQWEVHTSQHNDWIQIGRDFHESNDNDHSTLKAFDDLISPHVYVYDDSNSPVVATEAPFCPVWQTSPPPAKTAAIQLDLFHTVPAFAALLNHVRTTNMIALSAPIKELSEFEYLPLPADDDTDRYIPSSLLMQPIASSLDPSRAHFVAALSAVMPWTVYFENLLQDGTNGVMVVVDSCGTNTTYNIHGPTVDFVGYGDLHDEQYDSMVLTGQLKYQFHGNHTATSAVADKNDSLCPHVIHVFPTTTFEDSYKSNKPVVYAVVVVAMIIFSALVFLMYDLFVARRQRQTQKQADQTDALVNQLFPGVIRERLFQNSKNSKKKSKNGSVAALSSTASGYTTKNDFVKAGVNQNKNDRPIADLFPEATVLFADIAGFTAWSSIREPQHVFKLLENIFAAFDKIAAEHGVFKVETVGDCYVASVGVPEPCADHAVVMAKFARDSLERFSSVVAGLELSLGPDTSDLAMRFGIHSGPVTAGVLRGDRARFQLFGDTVNIASKIESKGERERIHMSEHTAALLIEAGYANWVTPREDLVDAKDLGILKTYWLKTHEELQTASQPSQGDSNEVRSDLHSEQDEEEEDESPKEDMLYPGSSELEMNEKKKKKKRHHSRRKSSIGKKEGSRERRLNRLVDWNCELLAQLLKQVMARRELLGTTPDDPNELLHVAQEFGTKNSKHTRDEVQEVISMPAFEATQEKEIMGNLSDEALRQLHLYVATIASMYRNNPFHNFEHASHVTMSVSKLLSRIVAPQGNDDQEHHDHSYGIASDPLTQFTVVLSALIHDVDHSGVPNFCIANENPALASTYDGKSIAEQNSVDLSWNALMSDGFEELRNCIFTTKVELFRFRQLLVNSVIATDIFDKELGTFRKLRWKKAFAGEMEDMHGSIALDLDEDGFLTEDKTVDRKATIVIEHLIQASDVAHTMQHWHVYSKWNERLFAEMYEAFLSGRMPGKNPSFNWYKGELGFFDDYIIPLAKKLKNCGVFGVASDEYLNYAVENRREWEIKGQEVVQGYLAKYGPTKESPQES